MPQPKKKASPALHKASSDQKKIKVKDLQSILLNNLESLAAVEHERWSHWQRYVHTLCIPQADGSLIIPSESVRQWKRLAEKMYSELTETEKESDRDQVRRYLPTIIDAFEQER